MLRELLLHSSAREEEPAAPRLVLFTLSWSFQVLLRCLSHVTSQQTLVVRPENTKWTIVHKEKPNAERFACLD